jgi:GT2 family glycosyltransferase/glycosyltransferase involved in cell wall biosynthesis
MVPITIAIPVFNAFDAVVRCIESVVRNSPESCGLLILDDSSTDPKVRSYLDQLNARHARQILVKRNKENIGFIKTANRIFIEETTSDVILLNSDCEVPPGWVERLQSTAYEMSDTAAVCPLSNFATIYSVPNAGLQPLPPWLTVEQMDGIVKETSFKLHPVVPTVMGFCVYYKRKALEAVGGFDEAFGLGYGDEVDHCLRMRKAGFVCVLADDLFVYHKGKASFGTGDVAAREGAQGENLVRERYPEYITEIQDWWFTSQLREHKTRIADRLRPRSEKKKLKVLHVLHRPLEALGGTEIYVRRLIEALKDDIESTVIYPVGGGFPSDGFIECKDGLMLIQVNQELCKPKLFVRGYPLQVDAPLVCDFFEKTIRALKPDLVHVHHLAAWGTWEILEVAEKYAPVVMTIEDEHFNCPVFKMGGSCRKRECSATDEECVQCIKSQVTHVGHYLDESIDDYIRRMLERWYDVVSPPTLIAPSRCIAGRVYGEPNDAIIIPHGCPEQMVPNIRVKSDKIRLAYVGLASIEKGWQAFREVAIKLRDDPRFDISVIGYVDPQCDTGGLDGVRFVGQYKETELAYYLQNVDISVPACMLVESYGIVIDECVASKCFVLLPWLRLFDEREFMFGNYKWGSGDSLLEAIRVFADCVGGKYVGRAIGNAPTTTEGAQRTLEVYREVISRAGT